MTETAWYKTVATQYGVPLDTRSTQTKSDWQIWTAAFMTDTTTRDMLISAVLNYASDGQNDTPFGDLYDTTNGVAGSFKARPVVGGHLALLISQPVSTGTPTNITSPPSQINAAPPWIDGTLRLYVAILVIIALMLI